MKTEYLPVIKEQNGKFLVTGKVDRLIAHTAPPVLHATAIIVAILPDKRILLTEKSEKQRKKGRIIPDHVHVYDCFGGHMTYDHIPPEEYDRGISLKTFQKCACRELSEELLIKTESGDFCPFSPEPDLLIPIGQYTMYNEHNHEISWAFLYPLKTYGPYASEDTLFTGNGEETISQPILAVTFEQLCACHAEASNIVLLDGIGRILDQPEGKASILNYL